MFKKLKTLIKFLFSPDSLVNFKEANLNFWDGMLRVVEENKKYRKVKKFGVRYFVFLDGKYCFSLKDVIQRQMTSNLIKGALSGMKKEYDEYGNENYPKVEVIN